MVSRGGQVARGSRRGNRPVLVASEAVGSVEIRPIRGLDAGLSSSSVNGPVGPWEMLLAKFGDVWSLKSI